MDKKIENKTEELRGKAKEGVGRVTDDKELESQGKAGQDCRQTDADAHASIPSSFVGRGYRPIGLKLNSTRLATR